MTGPRQRATARALPKTTSFKILAALMGLMIAALIAQPGVAQDKIIKSHGYSYFGDLSYPADFPHFNYVNPNAPKGGEISLSAPGTFDSMNPYSRKGRSGALSSMVYESLLGEMPASEGSLPADSAVESYGLLAKSLEYDEGKTWVIFHMRPEARFSDGHPVTAHDIVFSHHLLLEQGLASYAQAVKQRVLSAEALDDHTVKFTFAEGISRRSLIEVAGGVPAWPKHWYEKTGARLDEPRLDAAPGSGPYVLDSYDVNRRIIYTRNPDYWGRDLPINKGRNNFDKIRIEYFADSTAAFEAFKAGEYTFRQETSSKNWATGYDFPAVQNGHVTRKSLPDGSPPVPIGFVFNLQREKFQDMRVREAIALAFNFEWTNESLQFGLFKQRASFVQDTPLQAKGPPEGAELAFLQGLGDIVPAAMLTEPARVPHTSKADRQNDRRNLRQAMKLLDQAGWTVGEDGLRRNKDGVLLKLDFPISSSNSPTLGAIVEGFVNNLRLMGIDARYEKVDPSQFTLRRREKDYDMIFFQYGAFLSTGAGLKQMYGSETAEISVFNPATLRSPLVDAILDKSLRTDNRTDQDASLMALDRALRYEFFMIPVWYNDSFWVAYWDMYDHPETIPPFTLGTLDFWWYNAERAEALKASGALR